MFYATIDLCFGIRKMPGLRDTGNKSWASIVQPVPSGPLRWRNIMLGTIVGLLVIGLIAGFIARAVVPGDDSMSIAKTIVLGIVGSLVGGFLGYLLFHKDSQHGFVQPSGWIGSIIGSIIALIIYNAVTGRKHAHIR
jgi:uncharacterized membrane protein YeaQ/YmgE (transglycosylase-associated protein family)